MTDQEMLDAFTDIAQRNVPSLVSLQEEGSDRLDHHFVHVTSLLDMLHAAYELGRKNSL